jgi:heptosyltransferase-3
MKKILICIFKYHGDVLLTSPVFSALKKALPEAEIHAYLFKDTYPMLEGHPAISKFIFFDQAWRKSFILKRIWLEIKMWLYVRSQNYDVVINLTSGDRGALVALFSGAKVRIGQERGGGLRQKDSFFTKVLRLTNTPRHIVDRNLDAIRALGIEPKREKLTYSISAESKSKVRDMLPFEDFVLIHPGSRCSYKHWPIEKFQELIQNLRKDGENVILSGGTSEDERALLEDIQKPFQSDSCVFSLGGKLNLKELGALIERSKLLICVDTVSSHIASALGKKLLVIFGPSDDIKWGPWMNPNARVVRKEISCMRCDQEGCGGSWKAFCLEELSSKKVYDEVKKLLNKLDLKVVTEIGSSN